MNDIERDAARYRWLRETNCKPFRDEMEGPLGAVGPLMINIRQADESGAGAEATSLAPDEMDAAIDAAMNAHEMQGILDALVNDGIAWKGEDGRFRLRDDIEILSDDGETIQITRKAVN